MNKFTNFFEFVSQSEIAAVMRKTVENSQWHREANVWVHTEMVLAEYDKILQNEIRTEREQLITRIALLFHDFGKPEAEETLDRKDGSGEYRSYAGHEKVSANEFMLFVTQNEEHWSQFTAMGLTIEDARVIKFLIEHHLPYGLKNSQKRTDLATAIHNLGVGDNPFYDMLRSDSRGRISDNHDEKLANVEQWIQEFKQVEPKELRCKSGMNGLEFVVLVGPSGAGKSTWAQTNVPNSVNHLVVGEDNWRLEFAIDILGMSQNDGESGSAWYDRYWQAIHMDAENSKKFDQYVTLKFNEALAQKRSIILDNTNRSKKSRMKYTRHALDRGFNVTLVEFFVSEDAVNQRQKLRASTGGKFVKEFYVHQHFMSMEVPWIGVEGHRSVSVGPIFE
jgi:predicted kinase